MLTDVLCVPDITKRLVTVSALCSKGAQVTFVGDDVFLHKDDHRILLGRRSGRMLVIPSVSEKEIASRAEDTLIKPLDRELWHSLLGHLHKDAVEAAVQDGAVLGMSLTGKWIPICNARDKGKMTRVTMAKNATRRSKHVNDLVHSDIIGPMSVRREAVTTTVDMSRCFVLRGSLRLSTHSDHIEPKSRNRSDDPLSAFEQIMVTNIPQASSSSSWRKTASSTRPA